MSVTTSHWRNDSGELDVFEAARYFSGGGYEIPISNQKITREERQHSERSAARMSLDMPLPMMKHAILTQNQNQNQNQKQMKENNNIKIKYKQPSSPGGKLASFLNSLFSQTNSKKNKKKSKPDGTKLDHLEEENTRRRRRSSISHFNVTISDHNNSKSSFYNSSSSATSGFRTPPPYADTPNKSYKDYQKVISLPKKGGNYVKPPTLQNHEIYIEKFRFKNSEERDHEFTKFSDDADDHADSDSSSDLFDLPNHDLDFYPTGLPVYETTHMDKIKIGAPISSATATA